MNYTTQRNAAKTRRMIGGGGGNRCHRTVISIGIGTETIAWTAI